MRVKLQAAAAEDAEAIAALRNAISDDLTFKHGKGSWTEHHTTAGVLLALRNNRLLVALHRDEAIATLVLATTKPASIDLRHFSQAKRPLYLTAMAVAPEFQGRGVGRACLIEAVKIARQARADAIFLDAYDHAAAGAGGFYAKCGFRETGRGRYRDLPLTFYEYLI